MVLNSSHLGGEVLVSGLGARGGRSNRVGNELVVLIAILLCAVLLLAFFTRERNTFSCFVLLLWFWVRLWYNASAHECAALSCVN